MPQHALKLWGSRARFYEKCLLGEKREMKGWRMSTYTLYAQSVSCDATILELQRILFSVFSEFGFHPMASVSTYFRHSFRDHRLKYETGSQPETKKSDRQTDISPARMRKWHVKPSWQPGIFPIFDFKGRQLQDRNAIFPPTDIPCPPGPALTEWH